MTRRCEALLPTGFAIRVIRAIRGVLDPLSSVESRLMSDRAQQASPTIPPALGTSPFMPSWRWHARFSLGDLFLIVLGLAVALGVSRVDRMTWIDSALAGFSVPFVIGLAAQAADLWRTSRARTDLNLPAQWACKLAAFWRIALAGILVGSQVHLVLFPEPPGSEALGYVELTHVGLRRCVVWLALIAALGPPRAAPETSPVRRSLKRLSAFLAVACAAGMLIAVALNWTSVQVQLLWALQSVEATEPLRFARSRADANTGLHEDWFVATTAVAAVGVAANVLLTAFLARDREAWSCPAWLCAAILTVGLAGVGWYGVWAYTSGFPAVSPSFASTILLVSPWELLVAGVLLLLLVTLLAMGLVQETPRPSAARFSWRLPSRLYHHEGPLILTGFALVVAALMWIKVADYLRDPLVLPALDAERVGLAMNVPTNCLLAALLGAVWRAAFALWRFRRTWEPAGLPPSPSRVILVWLAVFATTVTAVPVLAGLSFALWLTPWYRWV
jgi:hypothetical protein